MSIGQSYGALQCITDKSPDSDCRHGEWYFPNSDLISYGTVHDGRFYRNGGHIHNAAVSLNRPHNVMTPTGQFCCKVPDATYTIQTLCVTIGKHAMAHHESIACMYRTIIITTCTQVVHW